MQLHFVTVGMMYLRTKEHCCFSTKLSSYCKFSDSEMCEFLRKLGPLSFSLRFTFSAGNDCRNIVSVSVGAVLARSSVPALSVLTARSDSVSITLKVEGPTSPITRKTYKMPSEARPRCSNGYSRLAVSAIKEWTFDTRSKKKNNKISSCSKHVSNECST